MDTDAKGKSVVRPSEPELPRKRTIRAGDSLLVKLPSGTTKSFANIKPTTDLHLGKFGSCRASDLFGQPYGLTYEIVDRKLRAVVDKSISDLFGGAVDEVEATNQHIRESAGAQNLTYLDIETLKKDGVSGRAIIERQIAEHSAFEQKTEFSKDKYIKRKEAKYLKMFTVLEPTVQTVVQYNFENNSNTVRGLRPDTISQMLCSANVRPGWRGIVVDDTGGLLVAAVLAKLGGEGTCFVINDADSPPDTHLLSPFNFPDPILAPLQSLNWAQTDPKWTAPDLDLPVETEDVGGETKASKGSQRRKKKKAKQTGLEDLRRNLWDGDFEALIIASQYGTISIVDRLTPYLGGSASLVSHSPILEPLAVAQHSLRSSADYINVTVSEPWLRRYQVLPGRTHPEMSGLPGGGFVLTAIRVLGVPPAETEEEPESKKRKRGE